MANNTVVKSRLSPLDALKWLLTPGETVTVAWPELQKVVIDDSYYFWDPNMGATRVLTMSDDPNLLFRPFLEKNVGKQGKDWMWKHLKGCPAFIAPEYQRTVDRIQIKLFRNKRKWATMLRLKWD